MTPALTPPPSVVAACVSALATDEWPSTQTGTHSFLERHAIAVTEESGEGRAVEAEQTQHYAATSLGNGLVTVVSEEDGCLHSIDFFVYASPQPNAIITRRAFREVVRSMKSLLGEPSRMYTASAADAHVWDLSSAMQVSACCYSARDSVVQVGVERTVRAFPTAQR